MASRAPRCYSAGVIHRGKLLLTLLAALATPATLPAQTAPDTNAPAIVLPDWLVDQADLLLRNAVAHVDEERAIQLLDNLLGHLQKSSPKQLAEFHPTATALVPWLEQNEETLPYAIWLRTRLDYFDAASELSRVPKPAEPPRTDVAPKPTIFDQQLAKRPPPPAAQRYLEPLKRAFAAEKVPPQLVWLAEVESSFDPRAKSPAGAAGLFQLTKPTAQSLGLSTWLPDERLNPEKSAHAAAAYLRQLFQRFRDWPLALAAYNAGETRVATLLRQTSAKSFAAIAPKLPMETQLYVPKVEATLRKREAVELRKLPPPKP